MTEQHLQTIADLRREGYAVVVIAPKDIRPLRASEMEHMLRQRADEIQQQIDERMRG